MIYPLGRGPTRSVPSGEMPGSRNARLGSMQVESHPVLLYDGVCGLCNRFVQFILRHDHKTDFRFAALQSPIAQQILARHNKDANEFDTVCLVLDYGQHTERVLVRSDATQFIFTQLGGIWRILASAASLIPRPVRDLGYRFVARHRYRIFGRYDTCPLPSQEIRHRFLDQ